MNCSENIDPIKERKLIRKKRRFKYKRILNVSSVNKVKEKHRSKEEEINICLKQKLFIHRVKKLRKLI